VMVPIIQKWIVLKKRVSSIINPKKVPYEVLLDEFDSGMTISKIDQVFNKIKEEIVPFIRKVLDHSQSIKIEDSFLYGNFSIRDQEVLNRFITAKIGFSFDNGRLDVSAHPMCIPIAKSDVRLTTRYQTNNFHKSLIPSIHEAGHGIYEQNLNAEFYGTPVADPQGNSFHESQSILWERHVGLSEPFWKHVWPIVQTTFTISSDVTSNQVYRALNQVKPGFIRVESDELTYMMHIILRYEIERGLFNGTIDVEKIPEIWNEKMQKYLGITPPTNTVGPLQDIHWALGYFGYFPSYLCGQMMAAQLHSQAKKELDGLENQIENGNFGDLTRWLNEKVHAKGKVMDFDPLLEEITGSGLNPKYLIEYVIDKYSRIYSL
jgi:carboxypeptidase Taq